MFRKVSFLVLSAMLSLMALSSHAGDSDIALPNNNFVQNEFNTLIEELGVIVAYNGVAPAESMGVTGFDVGIAVSGVELNEAVWNRVVSDGSAPSTLPVPKIIVRKGLPFGIDIGLNYTSVPDSNVKIVGGEIRKALIEGSTVSPALSLSLHTSSLNGVDDLDVETYGIDVGVSKGFAMLTPYASIGQLWIEGSENTPLNLQTYDDSMTRSHVGLKIAFMPVMSLTLQADFAETNSYIAKFGFDF